MIYFSMTTASKTYATDLLEKIDKLKKTQMNKDLYEELDKIKSSINLIRMRILLEPTSEEYQSLTEQFFKLQEKVQGIEKQVKEKED
jgi:predicted  nucleic acid-binding Zn-ribbon protein